MVWYIVIGILLILFLGLFLYCELHFHRRVPQTANMYSDYNTSCVVQNGGKEIDALLHMLKSDNSSILEKSTACTELLLLGYILVHKMINEGNKYDDKVQTECFRKSLTPSFIQNMKELEGKEWIV